MKNVLILSLLFLGVAAAEEIVPATPIPLSAEHKLELKTAESQVIRLQLEMAQLEKQYMQAAQRIQELSVELSKKVDETVLQYIKESERSKYTLNEHLDLVPNE